MRLSAHNGDVVKASLDAKDFVIKQLENYIMGDR
jgi:hypothetical protein